MYIAENIEKISDSFVCCIWAGRTIQTGTHRAIRRAV